MKFGLNMDLVLYSIPGDSSVEDVDDRTANRFFRIWYL